MLVLHGAAWVFWLAYEIQILILNPVNVYRRDYSQLVFSWYSFSQIYGIFSHLSGSTSAIEFVSRQHCTFQLVRKFELANQCMKIRNKYSMSSHQNCPSSVLCCLGPSTALQSVSVCFALHIVQSASLHSFTLVFLVSEKVSDRDSNA